MKDLIIIGAGNVGGFIVLNQDLFIEKFNIIGFLDDDKTKVGKIFWGIPVLGTIDNVNNYEQIAIVIGISNPKVKKTIINKINNKFEFPNLISSNSWISNGVDFGKGIIIYPGTTINYESKIEDFVIINMNCSLGHNTTIEIYSSLAPGVNFAGFTHVEELVSVGIGVCTIQNCRIGKGAIIGGQTMVVEEVAQNTLVVGIPGRMIKKLR